jgi:predicted TIM-barrel fold metal-dependent hydrolase
MIFSGVFERHPRLRFVLTEQGAGWIPVVLAQLDHYCKRMDPATGTAESRFGGAAVSKLSMLPSEYWARQCYVGASFLRVTECPMRTEIGVDRIMWGADYPHTEGTTPYSKQALQRTFAGVDPSEVRAMVGVNAAGVYHFDLDALRPLADRIGPTVDEVFSGLDEFPADAKSPAFDKELVPRPW